MATDHSAAVARGSASNGWWPWTQNLNWPAFAPQWLNQPINTGFSVGSLVSVTNVNSSAPDIERIVLQEHSYGRQSGRLLDAVSLLAERLPENVKHDDRIVALEEIVRDVQAIKEAAREPRLQRLEKQIDALRRDDPKTYEALRKKLTL